MVKSDYLAYLKEEKSHTFPLFAYPIGATLGYNAFELTRDPFKHKEVLIHINKLHEFGFVVGLMDLSLEAEAFGVKLTYDNVRLPKIGKPIIRNLSDAENLVVPDYKDTRTNYYVDTVKLTKEVIKYKPIIPVVVGPFTLASILIGGKETLHFAKSNPKVLHIVLSKVNTFLINYYKALQHAGAKGFFICESSAGMLSNEDALIFSTNYVNQLIKEVSRDSIMIYHNCGNVENILDSIKKVDCDIYHIGDYSDIINVLENVSNRKLVMGNISPIDVFVKQRSFKVESSTSKLLKRTKKYDNFIISPGCDVPRHVPLEKITSYLYAIDHYCKKLHKKKKNK